MSDFEREDMELQAVMGNKFSDLTKEASVKPTAKPVTKKESNPGKNTSEKEKPIQEQWNPEKPAPNFMDKLKQTAKDVGLYAVLSIILFWWKQTGRLDETTAWYALLFCVGMVFFTVGRTWNGAVK